MDGYDQPQRPQACLYAAAVDRHQYDGHGGYEHAEYGDQPAQKDQGAQQHRRLDVQKVEAYGGQRRVHRRNDELGAEVLAHHAGEHGYAAARRLVGLGKAGVAQAAHAAHQLGQVQHDEEAEQHRQEEPAAVMQPFLESRPGYAPGAHDSPLRLQHPLQVLDDRRHHLVAAKADVHPVPYGLQGRGYLLGKADSLAEEPRRDEAQEGRHAEREHKEHGHDQDLAVDAEAPPERPRDAVHQEAHDEGHEHQAEYRPEHIEQKREREPDQCRAVHAYEFGDAEHGYAGRWKDVCRAAQACRDFRSLHGTRRERAAGRSGPFRSVPAAPSWRMPPAFACIHLFCALGYRKSAREKIPQRLRSREEYGPPPAAG